MPTLLALGNDAFGSNCGLLSGHFLKLIVFLAEVVRAQEAT